MKSHFGFVHASALLQCKVFLVFKEFQNVHYTAHTIISLPGSFYSTMLGFYSVSYKLLYDL